MFDVALRGECEIKKVTPVTSLSAEAEENEKISIIKKYLSKQ